MRILDTKQIRELDAHTIRHEPISSIDLMERASRAFVDWFTMCVDTSQKVGVVCGTGNNGGDGLAIARMLHEWQYPVKVWIVRGGIAESADFRINENRLPEKVVKRDIQTENDSVSFDECDVLIDAIFGSGLSRPPAGVYAHAIDLINASATLRIAVDIPSGLMADSASSGPVVRADYTISFQLPKLAFMLPDSHRFTGEWKVVDIGLDRKFIKGLDSPYFYTRPKDVRRLLKDRSKYDHKGTFGHALLIAGSFGKMGAAVLAARAAMRSGVGLLTAQVPQCGYQILQTSVPEAMVLTDHDVNIFTDPVAPERYDAVGLGPGLGQDPRTVSGIARLLENCQKPVVIDADALNILGANRHLLNLVPPGSILTPHPREFERLTGPWGTDFERLEMQKQLAVSLRTVIVLKGAHTSVTTENGLIYFNSSGNPGMATAGTGDALTGVITGLLAQNYSPDKAAVAGVFLHGLAGDLAMSERGVEALTASDLIENLAGAFQKVRRK